MDRQILSQQLAQAEQSVAEGRAFIAQQRRLIVEAERDGEDSTGTFRVLEKFLILQQSREQERARILDAISETIASTPPNRP